MRGWACGCLEFYLPSNLFLFFIYAISMCIVFYDVLSNSLYVTILDLIFFILAACNLLLAEDLVDKRGIDYV